VATPVADHGRVVKATSLRLKAYILAADSTWISASVLSYYDLVEEIIVSYDGRSRGWTGAPIPVEECLVRLRALDPGGKMRFCPGDYFRPGHTPMENDAFQRRCALAAAGAGADWVLQIDSDEVLPNKQALLKAMQYAEENGIPAVEWPMRVLFRQLAGSQFLEVCAENGEDHFEYPGPIVVRPDAVPVDARRTSGPFLRPVIAGDHSSLQLRQGVAPGEVRATLLQDTDAILHYSWARSPSAVRTKVASWGHHQGWRSWLFYVRYWAPAPWIWRHMRDFHPFARGLWPALKVSHRVPALSVDRTRRN